MLTVQSETENENKSQFCLYLFYSTIIYFTITNQVTEYYEMESLFPKLVQPHMYDFHLSSKVRRNPDLLQDEKEVINIDHPLLQDEFLDTSRPRLPR